MASFDYAIWTIWLIGAATIATVVYYALLPHLRERYGLSWRADSDTLIIDDYNKVYGKVTGQTRQRGQDQLLLTVRTGGRTLTMPYKTKCLHLVSEPTNRQKVFKYVPNQVVEVEHELLTLENHRIKRDNMLNKLFADMEVEQRIEDVAKINESKNTGKNSGKDNKGGFE